MFVTVNTELLTMLMTSLARDADALGSIKVEVEEVMLQKGKEAYNNMLANILLLHPSPRVGSKGHFLSSHVTCQIYRNEAENTMQANIRPFYTPTTPGWGQVKKCCIYQSKRKEVLNIMQVKCFLFTPLTSLDG